jgi:DNA-binding GntR family transcriptional regulator
MDLAFHRVLGAASHNKQIEKQVTLFHKNASRFWYFGLPRLDLSVLRADIAAHLEVVDSIEERDATRAEKAMRAVLGHFPDSVRVYLTGAMSLKEERSDVRSEVDRREQKRPPKSARAATGLP